MVSPRQEVVSKLGWLVEAGLTERKQLFAQPRHKRTENLNHLKEEVMARYIALLKFTEKGAANIKKSTDRAHAFDKLAAKAGVKVEGQYWTLGRYDGALILSASDETKVLHLLTSLAALGNVHTETMQAFMDTEFEEIAGR